jgi:SAM-dependent methyltransferase
MRRDFEGFLKDQRLYERVRPSYPHLVIGIAEKLGVAIASGKTLDVGCGTGKATDVLACVRGARVAGLDPSLSMLRIARAHKQHTVVAGVAERLPFKSGSFANLVCAQSFHWFQINQALREFRRVLKKGGRLLLLWSRRDQSADEMRAVDSYVGKFRLDAPSWWDLDWVQCIKESAHFHEPQFGVFARSSLIGQRDLIDLVMTRSYIARLASLEQTEIRDTVANMLNESLKHGDRIRVHYTWFLLVAQAA